MTTPTDTVCSEAPFSSVFRTVLPAVVVLFLLLLPAGVQAQWIVKSAPELGGGAVRAISEVQCGTSATSTMILAGTTQGAYLDPTGGAVFGEWIPVNSGLPGALREIRSIAVRDSIIFIGLYGDGVYATVLSPSNIPSCRPRPWIRFGSGLSVPFINDLEMRDSLLLAATDDGVWVLQPTLDSLLTFEQNADSLSWQRLGDDLTGRVYALDGDHNYLFAGTFLDGAFYYDRTCVQPSCLWLDGTPYPNFDNVSVYDIRAAHLDTTVQLSQTAVAPCNGVFIATGGSDNLFFAPYFSDSLPAPPDRWINVSPSRSNPQWNWKINTILAGDFPGAPHALLVGAEYGGVFLSEDCGNTWREVNAASNGATGLRGTDVRALAVVRDSLILAGVDGAGIFQGNTFAQSSIGALIRQTATSVQQRTNDTARREPRFSVIVESSGEKAVIKTDFPEDKDQVDIGVYNLLAKRVLDVEKRFIRSGEEQIPMDISSLPRGMYICVIQGKDFRLAQKFVVTR